MFPRFPVAPTAAHCPRAPGSSRLAHFVRRDAVQQPLRHQPLAQGVEYVGVADVDGGVRRGQGGGPTPGNLELAAHVSGVVVWSNVLRQRRSYLAYRPGPNPSS